MIFRKLELFDSNGNNKKNKFEEEEDKEKRATFTCCSTRQCKFSKSSKWLLKEETKKKVSTLKIRKFSPESLSSNDEISSKASNSICNSSSSYESTLKCIITRAIIKKQCSQAIAFQQVTLRDEDEEEAWKKRRRTQSKKETKIMLLEDRCRWHKRMKVTSVGCNCAQDDISNDFGVRANRHSRVTLIQTPNQTLERDITQTLSLSSQTHQRNQNDDGCSRCNLVRVAKMKSNLNLLRIISKLIFLLCLNIIPQFYEHNHSSPWSTGYDAIPSLNFVTALTRQIDLLVQIEGGSQSPLIMAAAAAAADISQTNNQFQHIHRLSHIRQTRQHHQEANNRESAKWAQSQPFSPFPTSSVANNNNSTDGAKNHLFKDYDSYSTRLDNEEEEESDNEAVPKYIDSVQSSSNQTNNNEASSESYITSPTRQHPQESLNSTKDIILSSSSTLITSLFSHIDKQWNFAEVILIIVISAILNLVTIIGNIMVLISFKMDRSLQTVSNYFLLSLALADLLIGLISMPLYTLYLLLNYWPLGPLMCDIWLAIDYLNSNAAVLNMLIISFDRYFSVTRPLTYRAKRTTKHACLMISCAWILSLTIWTPAIFTYPYYKGRTVQGTDKCEIEFVKANTYLTFVTAILAFYIPVIIMIYLYWRIWLETKKRYRDLTTLFLVSGVGAAAPTRATRPISSGANFIGNAKHLGARQASIKRSPLNYSSQYSATKQQQPVRPIESKSRPPLAPSRGPNQDQQSGGLDQKQATPPSIKDSNQATNCNNPTTSANETNTELQTIISEQNRLEDGNKATESCKCAYLSHRKCSKIKKSPKNGSSGTNVFTTTNSRCPKGCIYKPIAAPSNCSKCSYFVTDNSHHYQICNCTCNSSKQQYCYMRANVKRPAIETPKRLRGHHHGHHHHHRISSKQVCAHLERQQHHHHCHQRQHHHNSIKSCNCASNCKPSPSIEGLKQSKLSLLTSSYQLLSTNTKSLSCASIMRKVHPTATSSANPDETKQSQLVMEASLNRSGEIKCSSASCVSLPCDPVRSPSSGRTIVKTVDTATSPIQFPGSPKAEEEDEERDYETRIVSAGNKFRFESDDLNLSPTLANIHKETRAANKWCHKRELPFKKCKHCNWQPAHYCRKRPISNCCADAMSIHDAECRICNNTNHCKPHNTNRLTNNECTLCNKLLKVDCSDVKSPESNPIEQTARDAKLPILGALRKDPSAEQVVESSSLPDNNQPQQQFQIEQSQCQTSKQTESSNSNAKDKRKRSKKFSQKLTFSDILVERCNSQRNVENKQSFTRDMSCNDLKSGESRSDLNSSLTNTDSVTPIGSDPSRSSWIKRFFCNTNKSSLEDGSTKPSSVFQSFCCTSNGTRQNKRISSTDSGSFNKNSSSDDSETGLAISGNNNSNNGTSTKSSYSSHHPIQPKSERKAAKTLSTLLLVFIVTWLPYNILVLIKTLSGGEDQVPEKIWNFSYYLCYINSTINPLCYALCNAQFRRTYMRILKCKLSNEHNSTRRLVPLQSSTTWNKDLRLTASDSNPTTLSSSNNHNNGYNSRQTRP